MTEGWKPDNCLVHWTACLQFQSGAEVWGEFLQSCWFSVCVRILKELDLVLVIATEWTDLPARMRVSRPKESFLLPCFFLWATTICPDLGWVFLQIIWLRKSLTGVPRSLGLVHFRCQIGNRDQSSHCVPSNSTSRCILKALQSG